MQETNAILRSAIEYAKRADRDVLWVLAAGNECRDVKYSSPVNLVQEFPDNVIVVAAVDEDGTLASFSDFGDLISVAAPGVEILSTLPGDNYGTLSGTSMATPHVTGLAALIKARYPTFTASQVKQCLLKSATKSVSTNRFKVIDANLAVRCG